MIGAAGHTRGEKGGPYEKTRAPPAFVDSPGPGSLVLPLRPDGRGNRRLDAGPVPSGGPGPAGAVRPQGPDSSPARHGPGGGGGAAPAVSPGPGDQSLRHSGGPGGTVPHRAAETGSLGGPGRPAPPAGGAGGRPGEGAGRIPPAPGGGAAHRAGKPLAGGGGDTLAALFRRRAAGELPPGAVGHRFGGRRCGNWGACGSGPPASSAGP